MKFVYTNVLTEEIQKSVKEHLNAKLEILLTKVPKEVGEIIKNNGYFAGGCIRSLILGENPKDYDIFFDNQESVNKLKTFTFGRNFKNSITLIVGGFTFQLIKIEAKKPSDLISEFDFSFNQNYYYRNNLYVNSYKDIINKSIEINYKCRNPFDTHFRVHKFIDRGYKLKSNSELTKIAMRLSQLTPLNNYRDVTNITKQCASSICDVGVQF